MLGKLVCYVSMFTLVFAFAAAVRTQAAEEKDAPGLKVGASAPAFKLKDQNGDDVSLSDLQKKGKVALVFFRSADW